MTGGLPIEKMMIPKSPLQSGPKNRLLPTSPSLGLLTPLFLCDDIQDVLPAGFRRHGCLDQDQRNHAGRLQPDFVDFHGDRNPYGICRLAYDEFLALRMHRR